MDCHYYTISLENSQGHAGGLSLISKNWQSDGVYHIHGIQTDGYMVHFGDVFVDSTGLNLVYEEWYKGKADMSQANLVPINPGRETRGIDAVLIPTIVASVHIVAKSNGTPLTETVTTQLPAGYPRLTASEQEGKADDMVRNVTKVFNTVTISSSDQLSIEIESSAGNTRGVPSDWWLLAHTPFREPRDWYHYDARKNKWLPGFEVTYQGKSTNLPSKEVLNMTGLPQGTYTFYFAVDLVMDNEVDLTESIFDSVEVTVTP